MASAFAKAAKNINAPKATAAADTAIPTTKEWDTAIPTAKAAPAPKSLTEAADFFKGDFLDSSTFKNLPLPEQKRVLETYVAGIPNPTPEAITKGYRKLALKTHPDKPGGDTEAFKRLNNAYDRLKDPKSFIPPPTMKAQAPAGQPTYTAPPTYSTAGQPTFKTTEPTYSTAGQPTFKTAEPTYTAPPTYSAAMTTAPKQGMSTGAKVAIGATAAIGTTATAAAIAGVALSSGPPGSSSTSETEAYGELPNIGLEDYDLPLSPIDNEYFDSLFATGNIEYET